MSVEETKAQRTLRAANKVAEVLSGRGIQSVLIGAVALAARNFPRFTKDVDLAVAIEPRQLHDVARELRETGFAVEVREPDSMDPLGGVLVATAEGGNPVEVVNFYNPPLNGIPSLVTAAIRDATPFREDAQLRVASIPHLVVFKLYAGGPKSKNDVWELLSRNPEQDLDELRAVSRHFRLDRKLDAWLRELAESEEE